MAGSHYELMGSRELTISGDTATAPWIALVKGLPEHDEVYDYALSNAPTVLFQGTINLPRGDDIKITQEGINLYRVEATFSNKTNQTSTGGSDPGTHPPAGGIDGAQQLTAGLNLTTGGATKHINFSLETLESLARDGSEAPSFDRMIGVSKSGIEGCDIVAPSCEFSITRKFNGVTFGWFNALINVVAHTNAEPFYGFDVGEVLFLGADVTIDTGAKPPIQFSGRFAVSPNLENVPVGTEMEFAEVKGHEYIWAYYEATTQTIGGIEFEIQRAKWAYRERVYEEADYSFLALF